MDASIDILSSSHIPLENQCDEVQPSTLQVLARIRVLPKVPGDLPFDSATFTLCGAIKSEIGPRAGLKKILELSNEKSSLEFQTCGKESPESYVDVVFDVLPEADSPNKTSFIPSFSITGQTSVTTSDVLCSQQVVKGKCDVMYWVEAEFWRGRRVEHRMRVPLVISQSSAPVQMQVTATGKASSLTAPLKSLKRSLLRRGWPLKLRRYMTPRISVEVSKNLGLVYAATTKSYTNYQSIAIPVRFVLEVASADDLSMVDFLGNFLGCASVEAKWYTTKTFSTTSLSGYNKDKNYIHAPRITSRSVVKQKQLLHFPPFYQEQQGHTLAGEPNSKLSATAFFDILLPDTIRCPTVNTELLEVSYELELNIYVEGNKQPGVASCAAKLKLPITIESV